MQDENFCSQFSTYIKKKCDLRAKEIKARAFSDCAEGQLERPNHARGNIPRLDSDGRKTT
jgi:hypothetical protein